MNTLDFLSVLNDEIKEKLINLCIDKNRLDQDGETSEEIKKMIQKK